ncbi:hypothetical protein BD769DRAFT_1779432 [Suillus cothurnatus]|nr:hypothetical protein BD769DRAFT_1779432 [Suillus cothurnatus]
MSWMNSGSNKKSETEVARLVKEVMLADNFDLKHLEDFSVKRSLRELDNDPNKNKFEFPDDWAQANVTISIPTKSKDDTRFFSVPGFHFRPLIEVIRSAFADVQANAFHLSPFKYHSLGLNCLPPPHTPFALLPLSPVTLLSDPYGPYTLFEALSQGYPSIPSAPRSARASPHNPHFSSPYLFSTPFHHFLHILPIPPPNLVVPTLILKPLFTSFHLSTPHHHPSSH